MHLDKVNQLLRNELSSVETYRQALEKFRGANGHENDFQQLNTICEEHEDSAEQLETLVRHMGGTPSQESGAWGTWAKIVMGSAKLLGDKAALMALKEGEESGVKEYQEALGEAELPAEAKTVIQSTLLPRQQAHLRAVDTLMHGL